MDLIVGFPRCTCADPSDVSPPRKVSFAAHYKMELVENLSLAHKGDLWFSSQEMFSFRCQVALHLRGASSSNMTFVQYEEMNAHNTGKFMGLENYLTEDTSQKIRRPQAAL